MDVAKLMQSVDTGKHLSDVKASMSIVEHASVVE
jgi:hypothetical protein